MLDHPLQRFVDAMSDQWQKDRAKYHMTLGKLIEELNAHPASTLVRHGDGGLGEAGSYRGYYCDLAFEPTPTPGTVADLLAEATAALGNTFEGYKGGDFVMDANTPLWVSEWGASSGIAIMGLAAFDGDLHVITKRIED